VKYNTGKRNAQQRTIVFVFPPHFKEEYRNLHHKTVAIKRMMRTTTSGRMSGSGRGVFPKTNTGTEKKPI
jgi:hypothetical protein